METHEVWKQRNWKISWEVTPYRISPKLENVKTGHAEFPIIYQDGTVGYDRPEALPIYVKRKMSKLAWGSIHG